MDRISTLVCGATLSTRKVASRPLRPGIAMSISTRLGCNCSVMATTAMPSSASPTTSRPGMASTSLRTPARTSLWSSANTTRIVPMQSYSPGLVSQCAKKAPRPATAQRCRRCTLRKVQRVQCTRSHKRGKSRQAGFSVLPTPAQGRRSSTVQPSPGPVWISRAPAISMARSCMPSTPRLPPPSPAPVRAAVCSVIPRSAGTRPRSSSIDGRNASARRRTWTSTGASRAPGPAPVPAGHQKTRRRLPPDRRMTGRLVRAAKRPAPLAGARRVRKAEPDHAGRMVGAAIS